MQTYLFRRFSNSSRFFISVRRQKKLYNTELQSKLNIKSKMNKLYLLTHPDFFADHPKEQVHSVPNVCLS